MKKLLIPIFTLLVSINLNSQNIHEFNEFFGCMKKEGETLSSIFWEIDKILSNSYGNETLKYEKFVSQYCADSIDKQLFEISKGSKLDSLVLKTIELDFWVTRKIDNSIQILVVGEDPKPFQDSISYDIEMSPESNYVSCSKNINEHFDINRYFKRFNILGIAPPKIKLCTIDKYLSPADYSKKTVKAFINFDIILYNMVITNHYKDIILSKKDSVHNKD